MWIFSSDPCHFFQLLWNLISSTYEHFLHCDTFWLPWSIMSVVSSSSSPPCCNWSCTGIWSRAPGGATLHHRWFHLSTQLASIIINIFQHNFPLCPVILQYWAGEDAAEARGAQKRWGGGCLPLDGKVCQTHLNFLAVKLPRTFLLDVLGVLDYLFPTALDWKPPSLAATAFKLSSDYSANHLFCIYHQSSSSSTASHQPSYQYWFLKMSILIVENIIIHFQKY